MEAIIIKGFCISPWRVGPIEEGGGGQGSGTWEGQGQKIKMNEHYFWDGC